MAEQMAVSMAYNVASEVIGQVLMLIKKTSSSAQKVIFGKKTFKEFSDYISKIEPLLLELWHRNVSGGGNFSASSSSSSASGAVAESSAESLRKALVDLEGQISRAFKLIESYSSGSWMYLFLQCKSLPNEMLHITQGIEQCLDVLRIASLDLSLEVRDSATALCETMRNARFHSDVAAENLVAEIEQEMGNMHSDSEYVLHLILEVAKAIGLKLDRSSLELELDEVRKKKEELEMMKLKTEACMLEQIQAFLCRSGIVSSESDSKSMLGVPSHFVCSLTKSIMEDPVLLESEHFERSAIQKWLDDGHTICPERKCELTSKELIPDHNLREVIQEWKEKQARQRIEDAATKLESSNTGETLADALNEISTISSERISCSQLIGDKGIIPKILGLTSYYLETVQFKAMECLCQIAKLESNKDKIAEAGGIEVAVRSLTDETELKKHSIMLLLELSKAPSMQKRLGQNKNCIPLIVSSLHGQYTDVSKEVLTNLSMVDENVIQMAEEHYYDPMVEKLTNGSLETKRNLVKEVSKLENINCREASAYNKGIIPPILEMIQEDNPDTMSAPVSTFRTLSRKKENCIYLLDADVVPVLLQLMVRDDLEFPVREQAAETLANLTRDIAGKHRLHRNLKTLTLEVNISKIMVALNHAASSLKAHLLLILFGLGTKSSTVMNIVRRNESVQVLLGLLDDASPDVRLYVMQLLSRLAQDEDSSVASNVNERQIKALVGKLQNASQQEKALSLRILCSLPKGDRKIDKVLTETDALERIVQLLSPAESKSYRIREGTLVEDALGSLLHFTNPARLDFQKKAMELGIMPLLVGLLMTGSNLSKKRAAVSLGQISQNTMRTSDVSNRKNGTSVFWCFKAAADHVDVCPVHRKICAKEVSFCLVNAGAVEPLVKTLLVKECGADEAALDALLTLLGENTWEAGLLEIEKAEGLGSIVHLLNSETTSTQEKAMLVLEKAFKLHDYKNKHGSHARFPLVDIYQQGEGPLRRRAAVILQLLGHMPVDSESLQAQGGDSGYFRSL